MRQLALPLRLRCARLLFAALALALGGCATRLPHALGDSAGAVTITANAQAFDLAARVAVSQNGKGDSFKLIWQRRGGHHTADVLTPIGTHVAQLRVDAHGATLDRGNGDLLMAADDAALFQSLFGVPLTLATLADWLHASGTNTAAQGWLIETERDETLQRVTRLTATGTQAGSTTRVRVIVDEYRPLANNR